ncbi:sigma-70 family RNA polymerase sigma factor [Bacillus subtilis]|uniref:sigma-70 family RNA polymerase sigma factor n=1 Tax=Bacillus subtilis TaxID=1423 RepID=UPI000EF1F974|nr:sigma-70 family RNA polymerase sigma factor [Bacillus subtilis]AYK66266.1 sigma-70 family RNA polymerase sigma factor [Bacillus subtilis subsp. subtilis]UVB75880.1 sigma-70 family RNA polymerase sigma factor [Bacillus subtilis]WCL62714.1 sigma-70 family RNA polymerase sigma factor [Bacillus subtilis]
MIEIQKYDKLIHWVIWKYKGKGVELEDLKQEAYLKTIMVVKHFKKNSSTLFSTFLVKCITNHLSNLCKKKSVHQYLVSSDDFFDQIMSYADKDKFEKVEISDINLFNAFSNLSRREQFILEQTYFQDLSDKEISEISNISERNIKVIRWRALKKLKKILCV